MNGCLLVWVGQEAMRIARAHGAEVEHKVQLGHAADAVVRFVELVDAELVVLGYKGHSRVAQFLIGTTAQKVNAHSAASVLIVKAPAAAHG